METQPTQTQPTQPSVGTAGGPEPGAEPRILQLLCTTGQYPPYNLREQDKAAVKTEGSSIARKVWLFGRSDQADLTMVNSSRLSNKHFKIYVHSDDKSVWIQDISTNGTWVNGIRLVKGSNYILNQGDEISVGNGVAKDTVTFIVVFSDEYNPSRPTSLAAAEPQGIHRDYAIKNEVIGQGAFATVKKCVERATGHSYAVKIINRRKALNTSGAITGVERELSILQQLDHPHIVSLQAFYEDAENYYIVMELVPGGDLMDFVASNGAIGEDATQVIAKQILEGIAYVHSKGISHRDLKPDNILIAQDDPIKVKITDFGLAKFSDGQTFMKTFCGTLAYVAPEIITGKYDARAAKGKANYSALVDMWSLGCLVYVLMTSHLPFNGRDQVTMFAKIKSGEYHEGPLKSYNVSEQGLDFLHRCLQVDPMNRITANDALAHPWIQDAWNSDTQSQKVMSLSQSQSQQSRRVDGALNFDASMADDIMSRPLENNRKRNEFKVPKRVVPMSQPSPSSQPTPSPAPAAPADVPSSQPNAWRAGPSDAGWFGPSIEMKDRPKRPLTAISEEKSANSSVATHNLNGASVGSVNTRGSVTGSGDADSLPMPKRARVSTSAPLDVFITLEPLPYSKSSNPIHIRQGVNPYCVGRNEGCDTIVNDERMSKIHCIFSRQRHPVTAHSIHESPASGLEDMWLLDVSTNSCFVNNFKLGRGKKVKLYHGDRVFFFKDHIEHEEMGFTVNIRDGTGLFKGGERIDDVNDDQEVVDQNEYDVRLRAKPVQEPAGSSGAYGGNFNDRLRKQRRQDSAAPVKRASLESSQPRSRT
ncbi:serine/threonine-protein kinase Rad53p [Diutina catenulata]